MHQRLQYLNKRSQVLAENISHADIPGFLRKDLEPFKNLISKKSLNAAKYPITSKNLSLKIEEEDIKTQHTEVEKELEIMEMSHNGLHQQAILGMLDVMHKLYKSAISPR